MLQWCMHYSPLSMDLLTLVRIMDVFLVLTLFVGAPAAAYATWKASPGKFNREKYLVLCAVTVVVSGALIVYAQQMNADVRTWRYLLQLICGISGFLLGGVSGGFLIAAFLPRRNTSN
jgi:hypothetical protein